MESSSHEESRVEPVAVVGMSCRYPKANNLEEFWNLLIEGEDATGPVPSDRWRPADFPFLVPDSCKGVNAGFLTVPVDEFDARFFKISPREATYLDPQTRLLLELVWEGLEDAGIDPLSLNQTDGAVFLGSWRQDYQDILRQCSGHDQFFRGYMGNSIGSSAARISFVLGMTGPSIATESGCSSGMVALHQACKSLQRKECGLALACSVNLMLKPFDKEELPVVLSPEGRCKTFDQQADGYARSEGLGVLVLKRLSDALKNGDRIWGVIRGSAVTQEGVSKSMGTPTIHSEALAMKMALKDAGVADPRKVTYIEAHGSGTIMGDPVEIKAITEAYRVDGREEPLIIGSVKPNVGHTESCSGITGIMKVMLAFREEIIPRQIHLHTLNPAFDLEAIPAVIPREPVKWKSTPGRARIAGVSSFGITGAATHVIIEEPPLSSSQGAPEGGRERLLHLLKFSAKSKEALVQMLENFKDHCLDSEDTLEDMAFTANTGRATFAHKAVILAPNKQQVRDCIQEGHVLWGNDEEETPRGKVCFLFSGVNGQHADIGGTLYRTNSTYQENFDRCCDILKNIHAIDLGGAASHENPSGRFSSSLELFCIQYALVQVWEIWGVKPDFVLGHGAGEYAAAVGAGLCTLEDALTLLVKRGEALERLSERKMLTVQVSKEALEDAMSEADVTLEFAAFNAKEETVVTGGAGEILQFSKYLSDICNLKCDLGQVEDNDPFKERNADFEDHKCLELEGIPLQDCNCGYISGVTGTLLNGVEMNAEYWVRNEHEPVNFMEACNTALEACGCQLFIEIGPHPVLSPLVTANTSKRPIFCLPSLRKDEEEWFTMLTSLGHLFLNGVLPNWHGVDKGYPRKKVSLPSYPFMGKRYWPEVRGKDKEGVHQILVNPSAVDMSGHPLLGKEILTSLSTKIYESYLSVHHDPRLEYLKERKLGETTAFPEAGYLDMCLAAMGSRLKTPGVVLIDDLVIEGLLTFNPAIDEGSLSLQTVMKPPRKHTDGVIRYPIKILQKWKDSNTAIHWHPQATATVSLAKVQQVIPQLDIFTVIEKGVNRSVSEFYEQMASEGAHLEGEFRSLVDCWENNDTGDLLLKIRSGLSTRGSEKGHPTIHPGIIDAMLQALMMRYNQGVPSTLEKPRLLLPRRIGHFSWYFMTLGAEPSKEMYVRVHSSDRDEQSDPFTAELVDSKGNLMAEMSSVEFVETSMRSIEAVIQANNAAALNKMPDMWEERWRRDPVSPGEFRMDLQKVSQFWQDETVQVTPPPGEVTGIDRDLKEVVFSYVVEALYNLGWTPAVGEDFSGEDVFKMLGIVEEHRGYFDFMVDLLVERGLLQGGAPWKVGDILASYQPENLKRSLSKVADNLRGRFRSTDLFVQVGQQLAAILQGKRAPLEILFPRDPTSFGVNAFYDEYSLTYGFRQMTTAVTAQRLQYYQRCVPEGRLVLRILEIGAGTGGYTGIWLEALDNWGIEFEYTYTDISSSFFVAAEKRFEKYQDKMKFRKLNIEQDPLQQPGGFTPGYFDLAVAYEVVHATRNIEESLRHVKMLLRPGGMLDLGETTREDAHFLTFMFGLLPGYWRFEDKQLRPNRCVMKGEKWRDALEKTGFVVDGMIPSSLGTSALICSRVGAIPGITSGLGELQRGRKTWILFEDEKSFEDLFTGMMAEIGRQVIVVNCANGAAKTGDLGTRMKIRRDSEADMLSLLGNLGRQKDWPLEGIFYHWSATPGKEMLQPFYHLANNLKLLPGKGIGEMPLRLVVLTSGQAGFEEPSLPDCDAGLIWGFCRGLRSNVGEGIDCRCVDIGGRDMDSDWVTIRSKIQYEMFHKNGGEAEVAYQDELRHTMKLGLCKPEVEVDDDVDKWIQEDNNMVKDSPIFHDGGTYLIVGATNGVGLAVAKWMVTQGAKYVVLTGRDPPEPHVTRKVKNLNDQHQANVVLIQGDFRNFKEWQDLLVSQFQKLGVPPPHGVIYTGVTLTSRDQITKDDWPKFWSRLTLTLDGVVNLHELTKELNLEYFVLFSSLGPSLGLESNYNVATATQFLDRFSRFRQSKGLPCTVVHWGQWGDLEEEAPYDINGIHPLTYQQGMRALEYLLRTKRRHALVSNLDIAQLSKESPQIYHRFLEEALKVLIKTTETPGPSGVISAAKFWEEYTATEVDKDNLVKTQVRRIVGDVLKLGDSSLGNDTTFETMGVDSLMFVEIKNALHSLLEERVTIAENTFRDFNTVAKLTTAVMNQLEGSR